jgi:hypothetical protein
LIRQYLSTGFFSNNDFLYLGGRTETERIQHSRHTFKSYRIHSFGCGLQIKQANPFAMQRIPPGIMCDFSLFHLPVIHCSIASQGLANVIDIEWLQTFSYRELQVLVSGAYSPVDLEDLKQHTHYSGGYFSTHPVIQGFWNGRSSVSGKPSRASCTIRAAVCIFFSGSIA